MLGPGVLALAREPWVRWNWVSSHTGVIRHALAEHLVLTGLAVGIGLLLSVPLALVARRFRWLQTSILSLTGILYTIPSLALLALLVPWTGLSRTTAEVALVSYTLLILIRNIVAGLDSVPAEVREASTAMGYGPLRQLVLVELPLALPVIIAGIRIAAVTTIGLVTVTALIGQGGLGQLILDGLQRDFRTEVVVGSLLSVAVAALADLGLVGIQWLTTPWTRSRG